MADGPPGLTRTVLFVTREGPGDRRFGLGKSLAPVIEALGRRGWKVHYLDRSALGENGVARLESIRARLCAVLPQRIGATDLHRLGGLLLERVAMGRLAAERSLGLGACFVHCHDPFIGLGFWFYGVAGRRQAPRWGVTEHGYGSYVRAALDEGFPIGPLAWRAVHALEASILRRAHWVISPTALALRRLALDLHVGAAPGHWQVVPHPRPTPTRVPRGAARQQLGFSDDALYLLAVGRFVPLKQFPAIVRVVAEVRRHRDLRLVVLGAGDAEPITACARSLGIEHAVTIGVTDDIGSYLSAVDAYISLSQTESFGLANLEALALGVPAVCSAVGGVPEVVGDGAFLVPPTEAAAFAALAVLLDPKARTALSRRALDWAERWPDAESVALMYERIYLGDLACAPVPD